MFADGQRRARFLVPHEHGAYGQLLFPLATALALGSPALPAYGLALSCVVAFLAHEPVLVLLGRRGVQAQRTDGAQARLQLIGMAALLAAMGLWSAAATLASARVALSVPLGLGLGHVGLIALRLERSVPGEVAAAVTLSSCALPVALAGGVTLEVALTCWFVFAVGLVLATLAVRSVIGRVRGTDSPLLPWLARAAALLGLGTAAWLALQGHIPMPALIALVPISMIAVGLTLFAPHPRHLRRIGWTLMASSLFSTIVLAIGLR